MAIDLKIADIARDGQLVQMARDEAQAVIDEDPTGQTEKYRMLWDRLKEMKKTNVNWGAIA
jgi:ATP-dependent DNA helicase RecG